MPFADKEYGRYWRKMYYLKYKEEEKAATKRTVMKHHDEYIRYYRIWRLQNKEYTKKYYRTWYSKHPKYSTNYSRIFRFRQKIKKLNKTESIIG